MGKRVTMRVIGWPAFCASCAVIVDRSGLQRSRSPPKASIKIADQYCSSRSGEDVGDELWLKGSGLVSGNNLGTLVDASSEGTCAADGAAASVTKVMVVVDSSLEAKGALEWALSHAVQCQDTVVLLHVMKPHERENNYSKKKLNLRARELLHSMKSMCQMRKPGVQVEVAIVGGKKKGPIIVEEAKRQRVSLLVIGQRKRAVAWRLIRRCTARRFHRPRVVEYCIQKASCMAIGVRRKSRRLGGYLISTKRHKNFWLLA